MFSSCRREVDRSNLALLVAYLLALVILLYPLTLIEMPPLLDYPLHVARAYILAHLDGDTGLQAIYEADWQPIPNLAMDLVIPLLVLAMPVEVAARFFLGLCLVTTVLGVALLHRVNFGRWSWWPLLAILPAYHGALMAGFVNFSFGLALIPFAVAIWISLRDQASGFQLLIHTAMTAILYLCHAIAFGLYALVLGAFEVSRWFARTSSQNSWRCDAMRCAVLLGPFLLAAVAYFFFSMSEVLERSDRVLYGEWRPLPKIRGALMPVLTYDHALDAVALAALTLIPLALHWSGRLEVKAGFRGPILLLIGLFLVLPGHVMDSSFIMERLPIAAVLIGIGATQQKLVPKRWAAMMVAVVLVLVLARTTVIAENWLASEALYDRAKVMSEKVDRGASVLFVSPFSSPEIHDLDLWHHRFLGYPDWHYSLINIPALHSLPVLPLTKRAVFSQLHFVWPDKQVLRLSPEYRAYTYGDGGNSTFSPSTIFQAGEEGRVRLVISPEQFRYVLVMYPKHLSNRDRALVNQFKPLYRDQHMILIDVDSKANAVAPLH